MKLSHSSRLIAHDLYVYNLNIQDILSNKKLKLLRIFMYSLILKRMIPEKEMMGVADTLSRRISLIHSGKWSLPAACSEDFISVRIRGSEL